MRIAPTRRFTLGVFAASLLAPAAARSEDFTFTVPVAVRDLPSFVHGAGVRCEVLKSVPPPPPAAPAGTARSSGESAFGVAHGAFQGNVTVRFNATAVSPGRRRVTAAGSTTWTPQAGRRPSRPSSPACTERARPLRPRSAARSIRSEDERETGEEGSWYRVRDLNP